MIFKVSKILKALRSNNINFFTGVPDSVLKTFLTCYLITQNIGT